MDDIYPQEIIKEYLNFNGLTSTLECLQAEVKSKSLVPYKKTSKNLKSSAQAPKLYEYCMGEGAKSASQTAIEKRLEQALKSNENTLKAAKRIFEIAVNSVKILEENKIHEETVSGYKLQLSKLQHEIGVRSIHSNQSPILSGPFVQESRNKLIHYLNSKEYHSLAQELLKIRVECLSVAKEQRQELINNLCENDVFGGSLNLLLTVKNHPVCNGTMALVSILSSTEAGKSYVLGNNPAYTCTLLIKHLQDQELGSVCQRFILASLEKLSLNDTACVCMIESKIIDWLIHNTLVHSIHPFVYLFSSALLFNLLNFTGGKVYISQNRDQFTSIIKQLLGFMLHDLDLAVISHFLLCSLSILQVFPDLNITPEIEQVVNNVRNSEKKDDQAKSFIFDICNKILNKNFNETRSGVAGNDEENIFFECFTDEAPLI